MARQDVLMEPHSPGSPASPAKPSAPEAPDEEANAKPDRRSSSSRSSSSSRASSTGCVFHVDASEMRTPLVAPDGEDDHADAGPGAEAKLPDDWVSWPEPSTPKPVDGDPFSSGGATVSAAPEAQTMAKPAVEGFNPDRIPASVFQPKPGSQADWSIASNESLFSIHGASHSEDFYAPSRSHFDYLYDEAMAAGGAGDSDGKLPPLAEMPGSSVSDASDGSAAAKRAIRRHESGSIGSSSNFSFAFPILAEPAPGKKESMGGYQQLQKEHEQSPTPSNRKSEFEEMTTEEERRPPSTGWCWCGECCACSWPTCCCQWRWRCYSCSCSCPTYCQCSWCQ